MNTHLPHIFFAFLKSLVACSYKGKQWKCLKSALISGVNILRSTYSYRTAILVRLFKLYFCRLGGNKDQMERVTLNMKRKIGLLSNSITCSNQRNVTNVETNYSKKLLKFKYVIFPLKAAF